MNPFTREALARPGTCLVVAEIGINHNGSLTTALAMVAAAKAAGCAAVKFQKRTVAVVYTPAELARPRESPFGTTNGDLKRGLELSQADYAAIDAEAKRLALPWFASCWDTGALADISEFDLPAYKVASASLTDTVLLRATAARGKPVILSTGGSTDAEVDHAVDVLGPALSCILHCVAIYPAENDQLNLRAMDTLRRRYGLPVGYSGHERGLPPSVAAAAMGACMIERHFTLDRASWGSDQAASVEPQGMARLVRDVGIVLTAQGDGTRRVLPGEAATMAKLRRVP